jgi:hypothetical protein
MTPPPPSKLLIRDQEQVQSLATTALSTFLRTRSELVGAAEATLRDIPIKSNHINSKRSNDKFLYDMLQDAIDLADSLHDDFPESFQTNDCVTGMQSRSS